MSQNSRKERVIAQYESADAATEYVRATHDNRPDGRFRLSRQQLVQDILAGHPGGEVLDAGCGPGVMACALLMSRPDRFRITVLDQSLSMTRYCAANAGEFGPVGPAAGELEALPFRNASFDIVLVLGSLEYADARPAVREISRVVRPGGLVIITMLNPMSPYRIMEWFVYWPTLRVLAVIERLLGRPAERRHGALHTGIRCFPASRLRRMLAKVDLGPIDLIYFDVTPLLPPFDRLPALARKAGRPPHERTITRGWHSWMGTGYLVVARRDSAGVPRTQVTVAAPRQAHSETCDATPAVPLLAPGIRWAGRNGKAHLPPTRISWMTCGPSNT